MRSTLSLPCYSPWSTPGGYRLSSPTSSDISCDSAQVHAARADREDAHARVYGSIVLGGEVYCPHSFKEQRYEPPGSPGDSFGPSSARSSSQGWSMTTGTHPGSSLCDHCDAASPFEPKRLRRRVVLMCLLFAQIAKAEVERFLSTLAVFGSNFNVGPKRVQQIDPTRRMSQQDPPPCNTFYLRGKCATGSRCRYGHEYELNAAQIEEIRRGAKWHPCSAVQHGLECPDGDNCIYGHSCPKGLSCRKSDCAFGADVNAEIIDLHGFAAPVALRELVYPSQSNAPSQSHPHPHSHNSHRVSPSPSMTTSMHATTSSEYYQVYPRLPALPASPFYEVMW
ncbi:hypothetical protein JCM3766R1_002280 [Sporobolomyces carnicolor]